MATYFGHKLNPEKGNKVLQGLGPALLPGEEVYVLAKCNNLRPVTNFIVVTNYRLAGESLGKIVVEFPYSRDFTVDADGKKETLVAKETSGPSTMTFKMVQREDHDLLLRTLIWARENITTDQVQQVYSSTATDTPVPTQPASGATAASEHLPTVPTVGTSSKEPWPTAVVGSRLTKKAADAISRLCQGDAPWLVLVSSGGAGVLAAWDDRLAIVKTGALTSFMTGSLGGERSATYHYRDITGIEYNSGFLNGVLEILTPSYQGTANKDYWKGSGRSRNADSNNPWTLSNTLPLAKLEFKAAQPQITELRRRISLSKQTQVNVVMHTPEPTAAPQPPTPATPGRASLAEELRQLSDLHRAGVLNDDEFAAAKQRLLSS